MNKHGYRYADMNSKQLESEFWWKLIDAENEDFQKLFPQTTASGLTQPCPLVWYWNFGQDFAAYAYELARRANRKLKLKKYPDLYVDEMQLLFRVFGKGKARKTYSLYVRNLDPLHPIEVKDGYSQPVIFRLDAPISTLKQGFEQFINQQRELNNIKPRKSASETSKRPPWAYIEILDEADLIGKKPTRGTDPQRTLRTARADAKRYLQNFIAELKIEAENNPRSRSYLWSELKL